ncbi:sarcosine oxidase subunit beta family protein [Burkholderia sp. 8Y]|uniref:sarcosine oxidase subunit beta family protein n=1 Tax=Burkholderia sp. 8Y TaxID=2653133 RepID=UPI00135CA5BE|nr:sarcosine oxidase subunit beta family protein [Burkholderia sp. 8Y]
MNRYSGIRIVREALRGNKGWPRVWRDPEPQREYDVIVIGGGGHGLATAYYLSKLHGIRRVAVLEKGYLGSGNIGRNTTIVRSNYMIDGNTQFYDLSMRLWETLSQELNYNVMFSQRGQITLGHSPDQLDSFARRLNVMKLNGIDGELWSREQVKSAVPYLEYGEDARFPIHGAMYQAKAGTARHDAVAWGYARAADRLGVDLIQHCEVTGFMYEAGRLAGVQTTRGEIRAARVGMSVAGSTSLVAQMAGMQLPIESHVLQAFVTEPIKPLVNQVVAFGAAHFYVSQSDKGGLVFGGDLDGYNSYAQRGNLPVVGEVASIAKAMMPCISRLRLLRHWGGVMDMSMDGSPIISKTPVEGLYLNGGWCYGGFKATPAAGWTFAHMIAKGEPHELNRKFSLDRFSTGATINESGAGPYPYAH